jgi:hypothetical protein
MIATCRLAAIPAADVVSYSRLMGAGEEGTPDRLKVIRGVAEGWLDGLTT